MGTGSSGDSATSAATSTSTSTTTLDPSGVVSDPSLGETAVDGSGCCQIHADAGCDEADVQQCVCDGSPRCCAFGWDSGCVADAQACNATCMPDTDPVTTDPTGEVTGDPGGDPGGDPSGDPTGAEGDCCESLGHPACGDDAVTQCTCNIDPYCCDTQWDEYCVAIASDSCAIDCANDCCVPHDTTACNDADVFGCVVEQVESCIDAWTNQCVGVATNQCGLSCA